MNSIYCINASTCFVSGNDGHVFKTTTGGNRIDFTNTNSELGDGFVFYPNPAYDVLNFVFDESINHSINISNTIGQLVLKTETEQLNISLDVKQLPKGVYFISINTTGKDAVMKKFSKM